METAEKPEKKHFFISVRAKLILAFTLLFILVNTAIFSWFYTYAKSVAQDRIDANLKVVLSGKTNQIDGDAFEKLAAAATPSAIAKAAKEKNPFPDPKKNPTYWDHVKLLTQAKRFNTDPEQKGKDGKPLPLARLYTFIKGKDAHEIIFIGSSAAVDSAGAKFMAVCTDAPDDCTDLTTNYQALNGQNLVVQPGIYTDDFGSWHSGYTPIRNSKGEVVGALGVDVQSDYVNQVQGQVTKGIAIAIAATVLTLIILIWFITGIFSRPIQELTKAAEGISRGDYNQNLGDLVHGRFQDEVDRLALTFNHMNDMVKASHQHLEVKVSESSQELESKVSELKRINALMVDREMKMIELKKEVARLKSELDKKK